MGACGLKKEVKLTGKTMGTTYHVTVVGSYFKNLSDLKEGIDKRLEQINQSMSTYRKDSEISRFNAIQDSNADFHPSTDFMAVLGVARDVHRLTKGAWDGTVDPLVNLWGFGRKGRFDRVPPQSEIDEHLANVDFGVIEFREDGTLRKQNQALTLDLASIAKGYGVDCIADFLRGEEFENFLVEIGGEVYASGIRKDGKKWRVGINRPSREAGFDEVYRVVAIRDRGFATSGDYRNFFEFDGQYYSHIIDPRTGWPVHNGVVSVTVIASTCTFADGLATALMVMGTEAGLELVEKLNQVESLIVVRGPDGTLHDHPSSGFKLAH
jgi:thiamine biosynthesis lipoprotein